MSGTKFRTTSNKNVVQITGLTARYYHLKNHDIYLPSITSILDKFPFSHVLKEYLMKNGYDASRLMMEAAVRGSKIHNAVEDLCKGEKVIKNASLYHNELTEKDELLTEDEWRSVNWFNEWFQAMPITKILGVEKIVYSIKYGYAGTIDLLLQIGDQVWVIDLKTGKGVWDSYWCQVVGYEKALRMKVNKVGILHLNEKADTKNKKHYKLYDLDRQRKMNREKAWELFLNCKTFWDFDHGTKPPKFEIENYPEELQLILPQ